MSILHEVQLNFNKKKTSEYFIDPRTKKQKGFKNQSTEFQTYNSFYFLIINN